MSHYHLWQTLAYDGYVVMWHSIPPLREGAMTYGWFKEDTDMIQLMSSIRWMLSPAIFIHGHTIRLMPMWVSNHDYNMHTCGVLIKHSCTRKQSNQVKLGLQYSHYLIYHCIYSTHSVRQHTITLTHLFWIHSNNRSPLIYCATPSHIVYSTVSCKLQFYCREQNSDNIHHTQ